MTTQNSGLINQSQSFLLNAEIELAPATARDYSYKLGAFINYCLSTGIFNAGDVTADVARSFIRSLQHAGNSSKSIEDYVKVTRRFFSWLIEEERLPRNPLTHVKAPRAPEIIIKPFNGQHIEDILLLCDHCGSVFVSLRNRAMVLVLLDTGLRRAELAGIKVPDIDIHAGTIIVMGKGARERIVGISKTTLKAIICYCEARPVNLPQLWLNQLGKPLTVEGISMVFRSFKKRAGFSDVRLSAHTFRHTSGTMALRNGASEREVQLLLGHSTPRMTQHYTATITSQDVVGRHKDFSPVTKLNLK